jgi:hypothetical protein
MSCITEILNRKADKEYLIVGDVAIESGGIYKDYEHLITFTSLGHRCGYVAINKEHRFYNFELDMNSPPEPIEIEVHGGVTFHGIHSIVEKILGKHCADEWIGFDAAHCWDGKDYELVKKLWPSGRVYESIIEIEKIDKRYSNIHSEEIVRDNSYMTKQCLNLIDQISINDK